MEPPPPNAHARGYYRGLGFAECGRLTRQVIIDDQEDHDKVMELFLSREDL